MTDSEKMADECFEERAMSTLPVDGFLGCLSHTHVRIKREHIEDLQGSKIVGFRLYPDDGQHWIFLRCFDD